MSASSNIRLVLVRPRFPENVGAVARAMRNFGLSDWAWVESEPDDLEPARRTAVHAEELLETAQRFPTLQSAVADCRLVIATSARTARGKRRVEPSEAARRLRAIAAEGPVALVFGGERDGLRVEEINTCDLLSGVACEAEQPSMNLAQSVLLYAYELHRARGERPPAPSVARLATHKDLAQLENVLGDVLKGGGFLVQDGRHAVRDLMTSLRRGRLTHREATLWSAALHRLRKYLYLHSNTSPHRSDN